jgi:hypothetical protein
LVEVVKASVVVVVVVVVVLLSNGRDAKALLIKTLAGGRRRLTCLWAWKSEAAGGVMSIVISS